MISIDQVPSLLSKVKALQAKGEPKYEPSPATKDQLIDCTRDANGKLGVGRQYREERDMYQESNDLQLSFYFLTRTCTPETERFIRDYMVRDRTKRWPQVAPLQCSGIVLLFRHMHCRPKVVLTHVYSLENARLVPGHHDHQLCPLGHKSLGSSWNRILPQGRRGSDEVAQKCIAAEDSGRKEENFLHLLNCILANPP